MNPPSVSPPSPESGPGAGPDPNEPDPNEPPTEFGPPGEGGVSPPLTPTELTPTERPADDPILRAAVRDAGCGVFWLGPHLWVKRCNAAFARFAGRSEDDLAGTPIAEIDPSWPYGDAAEAFAALRVRPSAGHATRLRRPDGTLVPVQMHVNYLSLGGLESLFGVVVDTGDRQAAEDALRLSEARYRAVTENQTEFILRSRPDDPQTVTFCNPAFARLVDRGDAAEVVGRPMPDFIFPEDRPIAARRLASLTPDRPIAAGENRIVDASGAVRWTSWVNRGIFDGGENGGELVEIQCVGRDVTERKLTDEALARSQERYRSLVEDSPELVSRWKPGGRLTFANRAYCEFFGLPGGPARGHNVLAPHDTRTREKVDKAVAALAPDRPVARMVIPSRRHDGEVRKVAWIERGFFREGPDGEPELIEVQSVGRDETERLAARRALLESDRRQRSVLDDLDEMVCRFRPDDGVVTYANRAFREACGRPEGEVVGVLSVFDDYSEEAAALMRDRLAAVTPAEPSVEFLAPVTRPDGTCRWQEWTDRALFGPPDPAVPEAPPPVAEFQAVGRDVTDRIAERGRRRRRDEAAAALAALSPREREVLAAVAAGVTNKVTARRLDITERTVEKHRSAAMRKLGVRSAAELVRVAVAAEPPADPAELPDGLTDEFPKPLPDGGPTA